MDVSFLRDPLYGGIRGKGPTAEAALHYLLSRRRRGGKGLPSRGSFEAVLRKPGTVASDDPLRGADSRIERIVPGEPWMVLGNIATGAVVILGMAFELGRAYERRRDEESRR